MKQNLKPFAYKRWEGYVVAKTKGLTACLLHNEPASYFYVARLSAESAEPERQRVRRGR